MDTNGKVVMVVAVAGAGTVTALEGRVVAARQMVTMMVKQCTVMNRITRDWHMDRKVQLLLGTNYVVTAVEAEEYKRRDAEVEQRKRGS